MCPRGPTPQRRPAAPRSASFRGGPARYRFTVHVPRRPYATALPGIPTIRIFEALACGIPLISAPWSDSEGLFQPGKDFLTAADGDEMRHQMRALLQDDSLAFSVARQ